MEPCRSRSVTHRAGAFIAEGSIEIDVKGKDRQTFSAGEAFYEVPDLPMVARTAGSEEGATFVVFQVGPTGEPLMVPTQ